MTRSKATSFTGLVVWQKSHEFVVKALKSCERMPKYDAVRKQLERSALSITSNIAEGFGRQQMKDKKHFYVIARGSAYEAQNQLIVAKDTGRITPEEFHILADLSKNSVKLLHGLIRSLERNSATS